MTNTPLVGRSRKVVKRTIVVTLIISLLFVSGCQKETPTFTVMDKVSVLWRTCISPALKLPISDYYYRTGETMHVPMNAAFQLENESFIDDFKNHFTRFVDTEITYAYIREVGLLNFFDYAALAGEYLYLCSLYGYESKIPDGLADVLYHAVLFAWDAPAWQWSREDYPNMEERLRDKLHGQNAVYSYQNAFIDEEGFLLATASYLYHYYTNSSESSPEKAANLYGVVKIIPDIIDTFFVFQNGYWRFQPGVWAEHPDYLYAGYDEILSNMEPTPTANIEIDTSHFSRFAVWLNVYKLPCNDEYKNKIDTIKESVAQNFVDNILIAPDEDSRIFRTKNYMSGHNGLFRYNYSNRGVNYAHLPYSSGTFYFGTWVFLDHPDILAAYEQCASLFPLSYDEIHRLTTLSDPNATLDLSYATIYADENLSAYPYTMANGFNELCVILTQYALP